MHTPSPWIESDYGHFRTIISKEHETGCDDDENIAAYGGHLICESVTERNVSLICAAPDLLAACKDAITSFQYEVSSEDPTIALIRAAIEKAEGR